jgi:indolepyruvate ferredoxin oxidoreductase alpha subunit
MKWVESSINEKVAMEIAGAAYARGAKAMVGMKNVGLNVASDPFYAIATTCPKNSNSAMVVVVADDPQAHSSAVEMDTRFYLKMLKIPALEPSNPQECLDFTRKAFKLSQELKLPVILRTVTRVSHVRSNVILGDIQLSTIPDEFDLSKEVNVASRLYFLKLKEDQLYNRMNNALKISEESELNRVFPKKLQAFNDYGIITSGVSFHHVQEALDFLKIHVPILKLGFINPFPVQKTSNFLEKCKNVLIVEEMDAYIEMHVLAIAQINNLNVKIFGKSPFSYSKERSLIQSVGELNPTKVMIALNKFLTNVFKENVISRRGRAKKFEIMRRLPRMCPGCPHRSTGYALGQVVRKIKSSKEVNVYFHQDIGCYTMLSYPPLNFANVKYCMGSSIASAQGVAHTDKSLNIAIIGDGTFFHAGIPALLNAIHHKTPILVLILDNGWIGMTGQQPHPGSDTRHYNWGASKQYINLEDFLIGTGANITVVKHEMDIKGYINKLKDIFFEKGLDVVENRNMHVILIKDECVQKTIKREKPEIRIVEKEKCNNCGLCYNQFSCTAIEEKEGNAFINSSICLGCGICEEICPNRSIGRENTHMN